MTGPAQPVAQPKKKEKAHVKTPIPGTDWLRVVTTEGNAFYSNKVTKQSSWTVPPEIADAVKALEDQEKAPAPTAGSDQSDKAKGKAKAAKEGKRKRDEEQVSAIEEVVSKKVKVDGEGEEADTSSEEEESDDEEEEEWQKEAAEQLAREAEEEKVRREEEAKRLEEEARKAKEEAEKAPKIVMPERVDLSLEEGKALFKVSNRDTRPPRAPALNVRSRLCCGKRISTPFILGIYVYRSLSLTHAMCYCPLSPLARRHSMSTAGNEPASFGRSL